MNKKHIFFILLIFIMLFNCEDNPPLIDSTTIKTNELLCPCVGTVTASALHIRSKPGLDGEKIDKVLKGHRIDLISDTKKTETIEEKKSNWYLVKTQSDKEGYAFGGFIDKATEYKEFPVEKNITTLIKCPSNTGSYACAQYREQKIFPVLKDKITHVDHSLNIKCSKNKSKTYSDVIKDDDTENIYYNLVNYYEDEQQFLIAISYWEGLSYYLLDENNAEQIQIWNEPFFSPDKKKFICISFDLEAGYSPNGVQIWGKSEKGFKKLFEKEISWGPYNPVWDGNDKVVIDRVEIFHDKDNFGNYYKFKAELILTDSQWTLIE